MLDVCSKAATDHPAACLIGYLSTNCTNRKVDTQNTDFHVEFSIYEFIGTIRRAYLNSKTTATPIMRDHLIRSPLGCKISVPELHPIRSSPAPDNGLLLSYVTFYMRVNMVQIFQNSFDFRRVFFNIDNSESKQSKDRLERISLTFRCGFYKPAPRRKRTGYL